MQWGGKSNQALFDLIQQDTGKPHHALASKPALRGDCIRYYDAFCLLGASRIWSQVGPQPLPISEILALVNQGLGIADPDTRLKYVRLIQGMDHTEIAFHSRNRK